MNAFEDLYKRMTHDIRRIVFITGVAQGNGHGKAIELPVQCFLRLAAIGKATIEQKVNILFYSLHN